MVKGQYVSNPNTRFRHVRESTPSLSHPGSALGRRELADLANAWIYEQTGRVTPIDANYLGKLERGLIQRPHEHYRAAFRAVLRAPDDAYLGFRPPAGAVCLPGEAGMHGRAGRVGRVEWADVADNEDGRSLGETEIDQQLADEWLAMYRRDLLKGVVGVGAAAHLDRLLNVLELDYSGAIPMLRSVITSHRVLEASTPSRDLVGRVFENVQLLRLARTKVGDPLALTEANEALSEGYGLLAWLCWDMYDLGSASKYYKLAAEVASETRHPTLASYMLGSHAYFSAMIGDGYRATELMRRALASLPDDRPVIAEAWIYSNAAVASASVGKGERAERQMGKAETLVEKSSNVAPSWPWVTGFDSAKLARYRVSSALYLGKASAALDVAPAVWDERGHSVQQALGQLDRAKAHAMAHDYDESARLLLEAAEVADLKKSNRVTRRANEVCRDIPHDWRGRITGADVRERLSRLNMA